MYNFIWVQVTPVYNIFFIKFIIILVSIICIIQNIFFRYSDNALKKNVYIIGLYILDLNNPGTYSIHPLILQFINITLFIYFINI